MVFIKCSRWIDLLIDVNIDTLNSCAALKTSTISVNFTKFTLAGQKRSLC